MLVARSRSNRIPLGKEDVERERLLRWPPAVDGRLADTGELCQLVHAHRVGAEAQARSLKEPHVKAVTMAGRSMTGFVRVMPEGYRTAAALRKWVKRGVDHVSTLPAKAARRKR